jgi:hypothetical protein
MIETLAYTLPWPDWVCNEQGEAWVRHDAGPEAVAEMRSCLASEESGCVMEPRGRVAMVQVVGEGMPHSPDLMETDDPNAHDAVLYHHLVAVYQEWAP